MKLVSFTLEPGDVIATGTPSGVGWFRELKRMLAEGDEWSWRSSASGASSTRAARSGSRWARVAAMPDLPTGTVTFLFTDIEGSTRLLDELGAEAYGAALAEHRRLLRDAFARHSGVEVDTQGDAFFVAFPTAQGALDAAAEAHGALAAGPIRVRMGIHTGMPHLTAEGYVAGRPSRGAHRGGWPRRPGAAIEGDGPGRG